MNSVVGTKIKYYRCFSKSSLYLRTEKTGSIYRGSQNWFDIITVALPYTGTVTATTTPITTSTSTTTSVATTTTTATTATVTTTVTNSTTATPTTTKTIVTTKPTTDSTTIQTTVPTTENTPVVITTMSTPTKKMTMQKVPTPYPTETPIQESTIGVEVCLFALGFVGVILFYKR